MDDRFIIYGKLSCPFCVYAIDFCKAQKVEYCFVDCSNRDEDLKEFKNFYNQETVPIILANNTVTGLVKKVGGYTDLLDYF